MKVRTTPTTKPTAPIAASSHVAGPAVPVRVTWVSVTVAVVVDRAVEVEVETEKVETVEVTAEVLTAVR